MAKPTALTPMQRAAVWLPDTATPYRAGLLAGLALAYPDPPAVGAHEWHEGFRSGLKLRRAQLAAEQETR